MEKIDPLADHLRLKEFAIGHEVEFRGKPYKILRRTTLASGEAALVLGDEREQCVVGASRFFAEVKEKS
jgi:hypothetical protein